MMETENKKKRPSSYEDFMNAHEYIINEKRLNWRNSITNNLLHQKNISKYEKLKLNILNRIKFTKKCNIIRMKIMENLKRKFILIYNKFKI